MSNAEIFIITSTVSLLIISGFLIIMAKKKLLPTSIKLYRIHVKNYKKEIKWLYFLWISFSFYATFCIFYCIFVSFDADIILIGFLFLSVIILSNSWIYFNKSYINRYKKEKRI